MPNPPPSHWPLAHGRSMPLAGQPLIMGILNVTPDSFSDGGRFASAEAAVAHGLALVRDGADILDIGGESTRPGSVPVPADEQLRRVLPVVRGLAAACPQAVLSIDTQSAEVAAETLAAGAHIVNDVSGLRADAGMARVVAETGAGLVLMHMQGTPATMQAQPHYDDVVAEVRDFLAERVAFAVAAGVARGRIAVDPGIGFGKTTEHNLTLLASVPALTALGLPVLVGPSRKRFISELSGAAAGDRLGGTVAACVLAALGGARILRVHDPGPVRQALRVAEAIRAHTA